MTIRIEAAEEHATRMAYFRNRKVSGYKAEVRRRRGIAKACTRSKNGRTKAKPRSGGSGHKGTGYQNRRNHMNCRSWR